MGRPSKTQSLAVWMNGALVGSWNLSPNKEPSFVYAEDWFDAPGFRSLSLSMPAIRSNRTIKGAVVNSYFDNLLPDSDVIRKRLQAKFRARDADAFALLSAVGRDCVGAIQLLPPGAAPEGVESIDAVPLNEQGVERLIQHALAAPSALVPEDEDDLRLSIAGAQEKTALLWHEGHWCKPLRATPTTHILKLPLGLVGNRRADMTTSVENEWLCSRILRAFDIAVAETSIATFGQTKTLVVTRFDRKMAKAGTHFLRLPQEDLCQATGTSSSQKYEAEGGPGMADIATLLGQSLERKQDIRTFLKTQIVFWMLRATDGHAKNFSIFLLAGDRYRLTPMYDVLSAWPIIGHGPNLIPPQKVKMAMAWLGKRRHYLADSTLRRHFDATAFKCGYGASADDIVEELIAQTPMVLDLVAAELPPGFPQQLADSIFSGLRSSTTSLYNSLDE
jgi:serine/threonine-protein kinase HipA